MIEFYFNILYHFPIYESSSLTDEKCFQEKNQMDTPQESSIYNT